VAADGEHVEQQVDRRVRNEVLFRTVNEKLRSLNAAFERFGDETALFVCECSRIGCIEQIELAVETFDGICLRPNNYVVRPGHQAPEVERVVSQEPAYLVVERAVAA
jgi:hypothetical protein